MSEISAAPLFSSSVPPLPDRALFVVNPVPDQAKPLWDEGTVITRDGSFIPFTDFDQAERAAINAAALQPTEVLPEQQEMLAAHGFLPRVRQDDVVEVFGPGATRRYYVHEQPIFEGMPDRLQPPPESRRARILRTLGTAAIVAAGVAAAVMAARSGPGIGELSHYLAGIAPGRHAPASSLPFNGLPRWNQWSLIRDAAGHNSHNYTTMRLGQYQPGPAGKGTISGAALKSLVREGLLDPTQQQINRAVGAIARASHLNVHKLRDLQPSQVLKIPKGILHLVRGRKG